MLKGILVWFLKWRVVRWAIQKLFVSRWKRSCNKYAELRKGGEIKPRLMWGVTPMLSNKYWSEALLNSGYDSKTFMSYYIDTINEKSDFDYYFSDVIENDYNKWPKFIRYSFQDYFVLDYVLRNYDILHMTCEGLLKNMPREFEAKWFRKFGVKTIVMPYGADVFMYSKVLNVSRRHGMLVNYPENALLEEKIKDNITTWVKYSDIFIPGHQVDGVGRWDVFPVNQLIIDEKRIVPKGSYNPSNGTNGKITIIHTPNHRGPKGTGYIIKAIDELKLEGFDIELKLLEGVQNAEVLRIMREESDIVVESLIGSSLGLTSLEAMASGLPCVLNLSFEDYTRAWRRFSYLNECPIVSGSIENIKDVLRVLIKNPELREELGIAGRQYLEKYHSYKAGQYLFERIYEKIWFGKDIDLMGMYDPVNPNSYNNLSPVIEHPLYENRLPEKYFNK